jgi:hypothetical protein
MPSTKIQTQTEVEAQQLSEGAATVSDGVSDGESDDEDGGVGGKCVYMVSDGTGWTAEHAVHAALGQFEHCLVDQRCSVDTHLFSQVLLSSSQVLSLEVRQVFYRFFLGLKELE